METNRVWKMVFLLGSMLDLSMEFLRLLMMGPHSHKFSIGISWSFGTSPMPRGPSVGLVALWDLVPGLVHVAWKRLLICFRQVNG